MQEVYQFPEPLIEGIILSRKNRFLMQVEIDDSEHTCHCPTTGRIGKIDLDGRPCLLSESNSLLRKTQYTVEAISLNQPDDQDKNWIGINQNAVNRCIEYYLKSNGFPRMLFAPKNVLREQFLGASKLDCLVDDTYIEVKAPLQEIQLPIPKHIRTKEAVSFSSTDRLIKHVMS